MGRLLPLLICLPMLAAASAPVKPAQTPLDLELQRARAEQASAEAETAKLEQQAAYARSAAERLKAQQAAAARSIEAAEARITAADTELRMVAATLQLARRRLASEQRPVAALLAGLVVMAERPPLLAIADQGSADEFVQVRALLDSTLPVIRKRTALLSKELREAERLQHAAEAARIESARSRTALADRRDRFAALEREAIRAAEQASGQALASGDVALAAGEDFERLRGSESGNRAAAALASALAEAEPSAARPFQAEGNAPRPGLTYRLPAAGPVTTGLGSVNASGVTSRGLVLATSRGAPVVAPADGVVRFTGPFRNYDGIVIIDHGGGWMSVLLNVGSPLKVGARIRVGEPLGRALGPLGVELSQNGRRFSPALIAGSSQKLSKQGKDG